MVLNLYAPHPEVVIRFHASGTVLHIDTDASYLVVPGAKVRLQDTII